MKNNGSNAGRISRRLALCVPASLLAISILSSNAGEARGIRDRHGDRRSDDYQQLNLVSDQPGIAVLQDTNLVNGWGISFSSSSPFWVSANGTGKSLLYAVTNDSQGNAQITKLGLEVTIPGEGTPSGQVFNPTAGFNGDLFIFASEDGVISGWRGALGTAAEILVANSNAVYKGITIVTNSGSPVLLAANFGQGTVEAYDTNLNLIGQFSDPHAPAGYAPFNVQSIEGFIFVTFAKQDDQKHDDVAGAGNGLIDVFSLEKARFHRLATGSNAGGRLREINSPWGLALAPRTFGTHGGELLVGNFGSGTIMSFEADGDFKGLLEGTDERPLAIDGLWGLAFGNGGKAGVPETLYFSAGPDGESHGLFGSLQPAPEPHRR